MRRGRGLAALTLVAISAVVAMCVYPTEHDADVFVTIDSLTLDTISRTPTSVGPLVVIQGAEGDVHATAWHRQSGGPSAPVLNVSFRWSVADTTLARIDATTGHLVAIKSGITQVRVVATNFDAGASPATLAIRVSAPLAIDSIRPDTVRYGEIATVYGVGLLDTIGVVLSIGDATLIPVPFTDTLKANGSSQISFWVPPPAHTAPLSYIAFGAGVFGSTPDSVAVIRRDIFEPNEIAPALIDLEARPFPGTVLAPLLFLNPALAFEPLPRDVLQGADWYRLRQLTQRDLTIVLSSTVPGSRPKRRRRTPRWWLCTTSPQGRWMLWRSIRSRVGTHWWCTRGTGPPGRGSSATRTRKTITARRPMPSPTPYRSRARLSRSTILTTSTGFASASRAASFKPARPRPRPPRRTQATSIFIYCGSPTRGTR